MSETHVGVIGNLPVLTPVQRSKLAWALASIALRESGRLVLHHGCGEGVDEIAHRLVRLLGGWEIHGHPAQAYGDGSSHRRPTKTAMGDLDLGHQMKLPAERDADIVKASTILIITGPCPGDPIHAATCGSGAANHAVGTAVREIFYLQAAGVQREPSSQTDGSKRATHHTAATTGVKDAGWATRQGREDRKAGTPCGSYKGFRRRYNLVKSEKTNEMWIRYYRSSQPVSNNTQRKSPSPRNRTSPSRSSAFSEERLTQLRDLQRQLNPPEAIRDAWR